MARLSEARQKQCLCPCKSHFYLRNTSANDRAKYRVTAIARAMVSQQNWSGLNTQWYACV